MTSEINRIGNTTEFNTKKLLNGDVKGNSGVGAANASATFDFGISANNTGSTTLTIGGSDYTINFEADANYTANSTTFNAGAKTITVKTGNGTGAGIAPTATQLTNDLVKAFNDMRGSDPTLSTKDFTFTNDANKLKITANSTGAFAGTSGKDSIEFKSGRAATISDVVEGSSGTGGAARLQIGANNGQAFVISVNDMRAASLGLSGTAGAVANGVSDVENSTNATVGASFTTANSVSNGTTDSLSEAALDVSTHDKATKAIEVIDNAIKNVSAERSKLGGFQNRLEHTINNLKTSSENLTAAESRVRDVDMAKEMMNQTKNSILAQAAQAMLAQSNQTPQGVLQLLR